MKTASYCLSAVATVLSTICTTPILALPITELVVFGDSHVDIGRAQTENRSGVANDGHFPPPNTVGDRSSDGPLLPEYVVERVGINQLNFAVGAATSGFENLGATIARNFDYERLGTLGQIDELIALLDGNEADPQALYLIWAGGNDFFTLNVNAQDDVDTAVASVVANLREGVTRLTDLGAHNIVIATGVPRPVLSDADTPAEEANPAARRDAAWRQMNTGIRALVADLDTTLFSNVHLFDDYEIIREIIDASGSNGFAPYSPDDFCVSSRIGCSMLISHSGGHKTTAVHSIMADRFISQFELTAVPEPTSGMLVTLAGLALFGFVHRSRQDDDKSGSVVSVSNAIRFVMCVK